MKISKDVFIEKIAPYGYTFENDVFTHRDGVIELYTNFLKVKNTVIWQESKNYVNMYYPDADWGDDVFEAYANDFNYHLSYSAYKDIMNFHNEKYTEIFDSQIMEVYFVEIENDENQRGWEPDDELF